MGIFAGPQPYISTIDPHAGKIIDRFRLSTTFNLQCYPAHNGRVIWITRLTTQTVTPFDLVTQKLGTAINIGSNPAGIWVDDRYLWSMATTGVIRKIDLGSGTIIDTISLPASVYLGLTGNGRYLWSMDVTNGNVVQIDPKEGTIVGAFTRPANATGLHCDNEWLWILTGTAAVQGTIKQYNISSGTQMGSFNITNYGLSDGPGGLTGDGRYLYNTEFIQ